MLTVHPKEATFPENSETANTGWIIFTRTVTFPPQVAELYQLRADRKRRTDAAAWKRRRARIAAANRQWRKEHPEEWAAEKRRLSERPNPVPCPWLHLSGTVTAGRPPVFGSGDRA